MMRGEQRRGLLTTVVFLVVLVVLLQMRIDPLRRQAAIEPPTAGRALGKIGNTGAALPFEYALGAVSGFRQVIAGLLWVRADSFFHQGNYDAILPLVRIITWMDPNWLDVYSTGAWHLMYNFTDEQQRSDRRYVPAGMALLDEGIRNNAQVYDLYADAAWSNFDKIKNFDEAVRYYQAGMEHNPDYTRVGHGLAHSLERAGRIDACIGQWEQVLQDHERVAADSRATEDQRQRARSGIETASKNLNMMRIRKVRRAEDIKPPVDAQFQARVVRLRPKVLEISGQWNLVGAKNFDERVWGPVDGARVDVRLQDAGYQTPKASEFSFEVDDTVTILQDQLSTRGGKTVAPGSLYLVNPALGSVAPPEADDLGIYAFFAKDVPQGLGVGLTQALQGGATLSAQGRRQLEALTQKQSLEALNKAGYHVAKRAHYTLGKFRREVDMSKDPKIYSFAKENYELILSFNPRTAPEFVQDRLGWSGEGLSDKKHLDTTTQPGLRMLRMTIPLTREDVLGQGRKVLAER